MAILHIGKRLNKMNIAIGSLTDDELKEIYEIVRKELDNRNIERGLPALWYFGGEIK